ncbi:hypothetical protein Tco_1011154, partial [Tanacetum coccineum]
MVCCSRLALGSFIEALSFVWCASCASCKERGDKGRVRWEEVRGELERYLGEWYWLENVGKGCMVFGAKWVGLQGCSFGLKEKNGKDATL